MNVVVLRGRLSRPPEPRDLPSGETVVQLEITIPRPGDKAETAPIVWHNPPSRAYNLDVGREIVVLGRVRRRFFRAGGLTQSRTEVVAEEVVNARQARRIEALIDRACALVDGSLPTEPDDQVIEAR
jgi:single-strand DNA-binding protein